MTESHGSYEIAGLPWKEGKFGFFTFYGDLASKKMLNRGGE